MAEATSFQDILGIIAKVPKDADRRTLIATIDTAVDGVLAGLRTANGAVPPDLLRTAKAAIDFLEQCGKLGDAQFRGHIKSRATQLYHALSHVSQGIASGGAEAPSHTSFEPAFADYLCEFLGRILQAFQIDSDPPPKAYVLNKDFEAVFLGAVRAHLLPEILKGRRIRNLADSVSRANLTRSFFFAEFSKDPVENPTYVLWTGLMDDISAALAPPAQPAKKTANKGGGMAAMSSKKEATKKMAQGDRFALAEKFFNALQKGAQEKGFDAPPVGDFGLFRALMEYRIAVIDENKRALRQFLVQENLAVEDIKAREGATRDWLYRIVERLPPYCGELLALWAYHEHGELFSQQMLHSFLAGQGTTEEKRKRAVPLFLRWMKDVIGTPTAPA